jgi:hypothetical protein
LNNLALLVDFLFLELIECGEDFSGLLLFAESGILRQAVLEEELFHGGVPVGIEGLRGLPGFPPRFVRPVGAKRGSDDIEGDVRTSRSDRLRAP